MNLRRCVTTDAKALGLWGPLISWSSSLQEVFIICYKYLFWEIVPFSISILMYNPMDDTPKDVLTCGVSLTNKALFKRISLLFHQLSLLISHMHTMFNHHLPFIIYHQKHPIPFQHHEYQNHKDQNIDSLFYFHKKERVSKINLVFSFFVFYFLFWQTRSSCFNFYINLL